MGGVFSNAVHIMHRNFAFPDQPRIIEMSGNVFFGTPSRPKNIRLRSFAMILMMVGFGCAQAAPGALDARFGLAAAEIGVGAGYVEMEDLATRYHSPGDNRALATDSRGRVLIAESWHTTYMQTQAQTYLRRLNADGTVDTSFGNQGVVTLPSVGSLTASRRTQFLHVPNIAILVHTPTFTPSPPTSGSNPFTLTQIPPAQAQKIFVAVYVGNEIEVFAYRSDGQPDTQFGPRRDGRASLNMPGEVAGSSALGTALRMVISQETITLATTYNDFSGKHAFRRLAIGRLSVGGLPLNFGTNGVATFAINDEVGAINRFGDMAVHPHTGQIYLCGRVFPPSATTADAQLLLVRLDAAGYPDRLFGTNGFVLHSLPGRGTWGMGLAFQANGRLLAQVQDMSAGGFLDEPSRVSIWAFDEDGRLDAGFGDHGIVRVRLTTGFATTGLKSLAVDADDRVYVGGAINVPATSDKVPGGALDANGTPMFSDEAFVARFTWDGQPDAVFGGLGLGYDGGVSGTRSARSCTSLTLSNQMPVCIGDEPRYLQDIGRTRILKFER